MNADGPDALIQLDTVHVHPEPEIERRQFTAVDVVSRYAVFEVRFRATAGPAATFLDEIVDRMPFPMRAIQVDGGSKFMAEFERACQAKGIAVYVLPSRSSTDAWNASTGRVGESSGNAMTATSTCQV